MGGIGFDCSGSDVGVRSFVVVMMVMVMWVGGGGCGGGYGGTDGLKSSGCTGRVIQAGGCCRG